MAWALFLLLFSHFPGSLSQPVLTQPPSLSAPLGGTARLTCTWSSSYVVDGYHVSWCQQVPGSPLRYLQRYKSDSDKHQGSGLSSRFSGSKDSSAKAGILSISGLQPEDETNYYCATHYYNSGHYTVLREHREVGPEPPLSVSGDCAH